MMANFWIVVLMALLAFSGATFSPAQGAVPSAKDKGLQIAQEMHRRDEGWGDQRVSMQMTLRNRRGQQSHRQIRVRTLEVIGGGDKSLTMFDQPRDVKGTAFLSFTHSLQADEQWLYLPALKRVKRISSAHKSGSFMGSEFAYEDLSSQELDKYTYRWLRDEDIDGRQAMVIERTPVYEYSGYVRQIVWIDKTIWRPLKVEYYDRKDALLKTLHSSDYQQYQQRFWRASNMDMQNHQSGKSTQLSWSGYEFNTGLDESDFDRNALKRAR
jgi:outer membrane lipoprotein-sorting protein